MEKLTRNSVLHKVVSELPVTKCGHHGSVAGEGFEEVGRTKARQDRAGGVGGVGVVVPHVEPLLH